MKTILNSIGFDSEVRKSKIPLEYRVYKEKSRGMGWHRDTLIDKKPQYELIYTIKNFKGGRVTPMTGRTNGGKTNVLGVSLGGKGGSRGFE